MARRREAPPTRWKSDRAVVKLTGEILKLQRELATRVVEGAIAMGERMAKIRAALPHGQWQRWIEEAVPFTRKTIANYMMLARWAEARPRDLERLAHLGPSKLYLLARVSPADRRRLTSRTPIAIPGGGTKTIDVMTVVELARVLGPTDMVAPSTPRIPIARVIEAVEQGIEGLDARVDDLLERRAEVDAEVAEDLRDRLTALVDELESAFDL
jgi:hypothetical protein